VRADGVQVPVIAEKPFSARYNVDSSRSLDDGSVPTTHIERTVAAIVRAVFAASTTASRPAIQTSIPA
jgi:hypothetical protein